MSTINRLPLTGLITTNVDAANFLREMADQIERGEWMEVKSLVLVMEANRHAHTFFAGKEGFDNARAVGLLAIAQHQHMQKL